MAAKSLLVNGLMVAESCKSQTRVKKLFLKYLTLLPQLLLFKLHVGSGGQIGSRCM